MNRATAKRPYSYVPNVVQALIPLGVRKIIVFGSSVAGSVHSDSDLDLLVVLDDDTMPSSFEEKMKLRRSVRATLRDINEEVPMDLLVYTAAEYDAAMKDPSMFMREIHESGTVVYESSG